MFVSYLAFLNPVSSLFTCVGVLRDNSMLLSRTLCGS